MKSLHPVKTVLIIVLVGVAPVLLCVYLPAFIINFFTSLLEPPPCDGLQYSDEVYFLASPKGYSVVFWDAEHMSVHAFCPIEVHYAGADWKDEQLGSLEILRKVGWKERLNEKLGSVPSTSIHSPDFVVECNFRSGRLISVRIDATKPQGIEGLAVSYRGLRVPLPASAETLQTILGSPLHGYRRGRGSAH